MLAGLAQLQTLSPLSHTPGVAHLLKIIDGRGWRGMVVTIGVTIIGLEHLK